MPTPELQAAAASAASAAAATNLHLSLADWLTIGFGVIGVVGALYGYLAWKDAKNQSKRFAFLFELADRNIDKQVTEEQLAERRRAVEETSARIEALQSQIKRDIPLAARRAVLADRLRSEVEAMTQHLSLAQRLRTEIAELGTPAEIPQDLLKAVEQEIEPGYVLREKISERKTLLTILTGAAAIASASLPWDLGRLISAGLLIASAPVLASLLLFTIKRRRKSDPIQAAKLVLIAVAGLTAAALLGSTFFAAVSVGEFRYKPYSNGFYWTASIAVFLLVPTVVGLFATFSRYKRLRQHAAKA